MNSQVRHPDGSRDPGFHQIIKKKFKDWIPAFAGMTLLFGLFPPVMGAPQTVTIETRDHQKLKALFIKPAPGKPVVVCLHGLASGKEEWTPLMAELEKKGWGVLAYDARGHGESSLKFQDFGRPGPGSPWERMIDDVGAVIRFVHSDSKQTDTPIILAGASVGANVSLIYASLTGAVRKVVLLSPGLMYLGFGTEAPIQKVSCPVLMVASAADSYSYHSVQKLKSRRPSATLWTDVKPGHGVQMFDEALLNRIVAWLEIPR